MKKYIVGVMSLVFALSASFASAAADTDVLAAAAGVSTTLKENTIGILSANIPVIILAGVLIMGVGIVWRLAKRFAK